jgi:hypothetical protein
MFIVFSISATATTNYEDCQPLKKFSFFPPGEKQRKNNHKKGAVQPDAPPHILPADAKLK